MKKMKLFIGSSMAASILSAVMLLTVPFVSTSAISGADIDDAECILRLNNVRPDGTQVWKRKFSEACAVDSIRIRYRNSALPASYSGTIFCARGITGGLFVQQSFRNVTFSIAALGECNLWKLEITGVPEGDIRMVRGQMSYEGV